MKHLCGWLDLMWLLVQTANSILRLSSANDFRTDQLSSATYNRHEIFINGTFTFAGLFPIHYTPQSNTSSQLCRGKFNIRGFEEALAMVYALQQINKDLKILPGITIGTDIEDTCSSVDFAIRKCLNFSFVKRNMENSMCERVKSVEPHNPKTVAIIGVGSSDVAMAVTNFAGLFYVPVVGYSSSSRLLSNRNRFKYFLRTISSDSLMARAVVDLLRMLKWNFVHVLYSDTDYGRSAIETFEHVLGSSLGANICLAVKRTFTKHTDDAEIKRILDDIKAKKNTKAKAVLLLTTTDDTEILLSHFDKSQMKDYVFISTDYFTGSVNRFQSSREMLKRVIGVTQHHKRVDNFLKYLQSVNESFDSCPWKEEYNKQDLEDRLEHSIYAPYVVDAVYAAAYGLHSLLNCTPGQGCQHSPDEFPILNRDDGLLKSIQAVRFKGASRDQVSFDSNGNGLGAYDITVVNMETEEWEAIGSWISNTSNVLDLPANSSFLNLNLTKLRMLWTKVFNSSTEPTSFCGQQCPPGYWMSSEERYKRCCWKCIPCSTNEISHNPVNGSCRRCPSRYWTNENHTACLPIIPTAVQLSDPAGIAVGVVSVLGVVGVVAIGIVFFRHRNTHIVRASSRQLSFVMLFGILIGYLTAILTLLERTERLCEGVLFMFSIGFCIVVGTLFIKTNRIYRIFSKRAMRKGTPQCLGDRWMLVFISCFVAIETIICAVIVLTTPDGGLKDVVYSDMKNEAYIQCKLVSYTNYNMALWWGYNTGLVVICTYQAFLTRKVPGNYNEARFIAFNMLTISMDVIMFFLSYYGTKTYYKDILVSSFLIVADTVTISCMFLPKVYVIVCRPQKNVEHRTIISLGTLENEEKDEENSRKISTRSNVSVMSSLSSVSNGPTKTEENTTRAETRKESRTSKTSVSSNGSAKGDWEPEGEEEWNMRPAIISRDSNLSMRTVRFQDEIHDDFVADCPNTNDDLIAEKTESCQKVSAI